MNNTNLEYAQVNRVLKKLSKEQLNKIPQNVINHYNVSYDKNLDQNISKKAAISIIAIFKRYIFNENENLELDKILKSNTILQEERKKQLYSVDDIFKNRNIKGNDSFKENALVEYKENIFSKILNKIKKFFNY